MAKLVLTDDQRTEILAAPDSESTAALARRLGTPYAATYSVRAQIRRGEWRCNLTIGTCDTCEQPLLVPPQSHGMRRHKRCATEHNRQRQQRLRHDDPAFRASVVERSRERQDTLQDTTTGLDTRSHQRWTAEDDAYLLEHRSQVYTPDGIAALAKVLGRSYGACQRRLTRLDATAA